MSSSYGPRPEQVRANRAQKGTKKSAKTAPPVQYYPDDLREKEDRPSSSKETAPGKEDPSKTSGEVDPSKDLSPPPPLDPAILFTPQNQALKLVDVIQQQLDGNVFDRKHDALYNILLLKRALDGYCIEAQEYRREYRRNLVRVVSEYDDLMEKDEICVERLVGERFDFWFFREGGREDGNGGLEREKREVSREVAKLTATKRRWNTVWAAELDEEVKTLKVA